MTRQYGDQPDLPEDGQQALSVLRAAWGAHEQAGADPDEICGSTKACKSLDDVGFGGMTDDHDLHGAWRATLERDGKRDGGASSIGDMVLGPADDPR